MTEDCFDDMFLSCWQAPQSVASPMVKLKTKLKSLKGAIKSWQSNHALIDFQAVAKEMACWELRAESKDFGPEETVAFTKARSDYFLAERSHTLSLKQKSRLKWAADGDENNRFFHGIICRRLKKNNIHGLNINGSWVENPTFVKAEIKRHFEKQFTEPELVRPVFASNKFKTLLSSQVATLECSLSEDEIKQAVWSCEGSKAPVPDGFNINFVKKHWDFLKSDLF